MKQIKIMLGISAAAVLALTGAVIGNNMANEAVEASGSTATRSITYTGGKNQATATNTYYNATNLTGGNTGSYVRTIIQAVSLGGYKLNASTYYVYSMFKQVGSTDSYTCVYYVNVMAMNPASFSIAFNCSDGTTVPGMTVSKLDGSGNATAYSSSITSGSTYNNLSGSGFKGLRFSLSSTGGSAYSSRSCGITSLTVTWNC